MNMQAKILSVFVCALCTVTLFGSATDVPVVSDVTFDQPGGGRTVTVTYNLQYAPAIVTVDVLTNGVSIGADKVTRLEGDVNRVVQPGARQFKWFARRDWPDQLISENIVSVKLRAWSIFSPPPYMVADLETPSNVTYYVSADAIPGGVTNNIYKTSRIVMRRIDAVGIRWNMGRHPTENGYTSSRPQDKIHSVQLTNDYYIGVFELTQGQWKRIAGFYQYSDVQTEGVREVYPLQYVAFTEMREAAPVSSGNPPALDSNSSYIFPAPPAPNSFLGTLSSLTGVAFDLPSECEWEYACRAGNYGAKWGDGSLIQQKGGADAGEDTNLTRLGAYSKNANAIQPVGSYEPNSWGLYDMHGNLWEMCLDWYGVDITALDGAVNPTPPSNNRRVDRGGAKHSTQYQCHSAYRDSDNPQGRSLGIGYRLVSRIAQ